MLGFTSLGAKALGEVNPTVTGTNPDPVATVSAVIVSPSTATGSQNFSAVVQGNNSPPQSVTWSKSGGGTLSSSGAFTEPSRTSSIQTITITATSTFDPTKSGSATVTIAAAVITDPGAGVVFPSPSTVLSGTKYGPTGTEYTGTYVPATGGGTGATADEIAAAVWSYQTALSVPRFEALK